MKVLATPMAVLEIAMGASSIALLWVGRLLSQISPTDGGVATPWMGLITQFGGLGLAIWLVILHTTKTIPKMQDDHRQERAEMQKAFNERCEKQEKCFADSLQKIVNETKRP